MTEEVRLRECEPWCDAVGRNDGHRDLHPDDRSCWSDYFDVPMSTYPPIRNAEDRFVYDSVDVFLRRQPEDIEPLLHIHHGWNDTEVAFTIDEARDLRDLIDTLIEKAEKATAARMVTR